MLWNLIDQSCQNFISERKRTIEGLGLCMLGHFQLRLEVMPHAEEKVC